MNPCNRIVPVAVSEIADGAMPMTGMVPIASASDITTSFDVVCIQTV